MVSPNLVRRRDTESISDINNNTKKLFQVIYSEQKKKELTPDEDIPKIKVSALVSKVAFFYEKIRNAVDYDEDHLLRKNAIARIIRRQVMIEGVVKIADSEKIAKHLLVELIRGSYLPNDSIPEAKIKEIAILLDKYIRLRSQVILEINSKLDLKNDIGRTKDLISEKNQLVYWLLNLAACEVEENLGEDKVKQVIVNNMFAALTQKIELPLGSGYKNDLDIQIYLSICRSYLKFDRTMLSFVLFKYYNTNWLELNKNNSLGSKEIEQIRKIASNIDRIKVLINQQLDHPLNKQLNKIVHHYSLYFSILAETVDSDPVRVYNDLQTGERKFINLIRKVCAHRYKKAKSKLWRAATRSIIYIFITKSVFAILLEIPATHWFGEKLNPISLAINVSFPALLLFFIVLMARTPRDNNTTKIINGIKEITFFDQEKKSPKVLRRPLKRKWLIDGIFRLIYTASFFVSIYFIVWVLTKIDFTWVSIIIFLFFLAFVSFFSIIVTRDVKELIVIERRENLITFFIDLFYMPIIIVGRWLSDNVSRINIFIFVFDFILEAPFKILVEVGEDWTKYVRERRDSMER